MAAITRSYYPNYENTAPQYEPEKIRKSKEEYFLRAEAEVKAQAKTYSKSQEIPAYVVLTIALSLIAFLAAALLFIFSRSSLRTAQLGVEELKKEYRSYVTENAFLENTLDEAIDYDAIYTYATETLGMTAPTSDQIITYHHHAGEYVLKEAAIPHD